MRITFELGGHLWEANTNEEAISLAIPQTFGADQPRAFDLPAARAEPVDQPGFTGDVTDGASCNCRRLELIPHANGTHTETVGHLMNTSFAPDDTLSGGPMPALVLSVNVTDFAETDDEYAGRSEPNDQVITKQSLEAAQQSSEVEFADLKHETDAAIVVESATGVADRATRDWSGTNPPYFTADAIDAIANQGFTHLLCDLPSVDREDDGGLLPNHRRWWNLPQDPDSSLAVNSPARFRTITEMIDPPASCSDGLYLLDLQVPALITDAVPSRPILYPVSRLSE